MKAENYSKGRSRRTFLGELAAGVLATSLVRAADSGTIADLIYRSASELARLIRAKSVSSEEVVRACLARISEVNPKLNAVCQVDEKGALAAARAADAVLAKGGEVGKLHGVPITIKDSFDVKGIVSTGGTEGRRGFLPEKDATVVTKLRAAGAIILGKTNSPELTLSYDTDNLIYGRTRNPFDLTRSPGGSSGGAAAIVAVGGAALDIGSDTAGSIRIPAHFCGVAGLKPTMGSVSRAGHILGPGGSVGRRTHVGPMARFVEDLGLVYSIIAGVDQNDPEVVAGPGRIEDWAKVDLASLRVAYFAENGKAKVSSEMALAVRSVTETLRAAGLKCQEARPPGFETTGELTGAINRRDRGEYYEKLLQRCGTTKLHPQTAGILEQMRKGLPEGRDVLREWTHLRELNKKFMEDFEVIISPPCSSFAMTPQLGGLIDYSYASFFNLLGWPAAVVRVGRTAGGLPKGIQIVGRPWKENEVLAVAALLEKKLGGWKRDFKEEIFASK